MKWIHYTYSTNNDYRSNVHTYKIDIDKPYNTYVHCTLQLYYLQDEKLKMPVVLQNNMQRT